MQTVVESGVRVEKLYRVKEVAALTGKHEKTIYADIRTGRCKAEYLGGPRSIRISESNLVKYLEYLRSGYHYS